MGIHSANVPHEQRARSGSCEVGVFNCDEMRISVRDRRGLRHDEAYCILEGTARHPFSLLMNPPETGSLFDGLSATNSVASERPSPAMEEAISLLDGRNPSLGNLLSSPKAASYVAILCAFLDFRREHEFEPLFEDLQEKVCGEDAGAFSRMDFGSDLNQLQEWNLVERRVEKERVRGYRDNRRKKFRHRASPDAIALVNWLRNRKDELLHPRSEDTGSLLDLVDSMLKEASRQINRLSAGAVSYEDASDLMFRAQRLSDLSDDVAENLQKLDLRLVSFLVREYELAEAKALVGEIEVFLQRFALRIGRFRASILANAEKLLQLRYESRWAACENVLRQEADKVRRLRPLVVPNSRDILAGLVAFYQSGGRLQNLMQRVQRSGREVWRRLSAHLRELERRNHRLEDLRARISELAALPEDSVPHEWFHDLLQAASMRGDALIRPDGRSRAPEPVWEKHRIGPGLDAAIDHRNDTDSEDRVSSFDETRLRSLADWLSAKGLLPSPGDPPIPLSSAEMDVDEDFRRVIETASASLLGGGRRAAKISLSGTVAEDRPVALALGDRTLSFQELLLSAR